MPGSSNFLQHNPTKANQESDGTYSTETLRTGGIPVDAILPSAWLNKIWYQCTTMVGALAQMMAAKGYTISDANLNTLAGVLANILTGADLPLAIGSGGTGSATFDDAGLIHIIGGIDLVGQTGNLGNQPYSVGLGAAIRCFRISMWVGVKSPVGSSSLTINLHFTSDGTSYTRAIIIATAVVGSQEYSGMYFIHADSSSTIEYSGTWTSGGSGDSYEVHTRLEAVSLS